MDGRATRRPGRAVGLAVKRLVDVTLSLTGLLLFAPIMLLAALAIRLTMGSPVLFRQVRPGLNERPFTICKFRTMRLSDGPDGRPLPDVQRITPLGRFLRRTSLDELPQLWNVLKGEMSLIGPRPLLMEYLPYYLPQERVRHLMRPGITGLAQVSGRTMLGWDQRLALDAEYVNNWSLWLDAKLFWRTVGKVVAQADIAEVYHQGPLSRYRRGQGREMG